MLTVRDIQKHARTNYSAKDFNYQEGYMIEFWARNQFVVETGVYFHWQNNEPVDVAIDLSCMSGCTQNCKFCASGAVEKCNILTRDEIVEQAKEAMYQAAAIQKAFMQTVKKVTFSFEGMGEPSNMADVIAEAIIQLRKEYVSPPYTLQFIISTILANPLALQSWQNDEVGLHSLQVSLHGATDATRTELLGNSTSIANIFKAVDDFAEQSRDTEIKVNYVLIADRNDKDSDLVSLCHFMKVRPKYFLKISILNSTQPCRQNDLHRSKRIEHFINKCTESHERTYRYGGNEELWISCGQLATYASRSNLSDQHRRYIREIYNQLIERNVVLFIGAGASRTIKLTSDIAKHYYGNLGLTVPFDQLKPDLAKVADYFEARNDLAYMHDSLQQLLEGAAPPPEYYNLPHFGWHAIYTTNYDCLIEKAYECAVQKGSTRRCHAYTDDASITSNPRYNEIPLIKLHGSVSNNLRNAALSGRDYLDGYTNKRTYLFKLFETDCLRNTLVFAGYGLHDHYIAQILFDVRNRVNHTGNAYAIMPFDDVPIADLEAQSLKLKFGIELIPCRFDQFMAELTRVRRLVTVFASGSSKAQILGGKTREDCNSLIETFAKELAVAFSHQSIRLITGATARDKFGYLLGQQMSDQSLVTTYIQHNADDIKADPTDRVGDMIRVHRYGYHPMDIVGRLVRESHVMILVGGSGYSLEEFKRASAAGRLIIPVALGDSSYASDIVHGFMAGNSQFLMQFAADEGFVGKQKKRAIPAISSDRFRLLDLKNNPPLIVASTIMEILCEFRANYLAAQDSVFI